MHRWVFIAIFLILPNLPACSEQRSGPPDSAGDHASRSEAAATAGTTEKASAEAQSERYVVRLRQGESLGRLSEWSGVSKADILRASGLDAEGRPGVGAFLSLDMTPAKAASFMDHRLSRLGGRTLVQTVDDRIQAAGKAAAERREKVTILIRRDEMIGLLAEWAGVGLSEVRAANPSVNLDRVHVGQKVVLPLPVGRRIDFEEAREAWHADRAAPSAPVVADKVKLVPPVPPAPEEKAACGRGYRLRHGDIVSKLARRWGVTLRDVRHCNKDLNLDRVSAGSRIRVPDAARSSYAEEFSK